MQETLLHLRTQHVLVGLATFTLSQSTLEQIFLGVAKAEAEAEARQAEADKRLEEEAKARNPCRPRA